MDFIFWNEGFIFILLFVVMVGVPCLAASILGVKLIDSIGMYPTQNSRLQMSICLQLLLIEIGAFGLLALFFHIFSD